MSSPGPLTALLARLAEAPPAEGQPPPLVPGTRAGRYEIIRAIGSGGFGTVYQAHDTTLNRLVAVKAFHAPSTSRPATASEAEAAARLAHPNIAALYDAGATEDGHPYLVYEILHGETLESRLSRGPVPPRQAVAIATQVARALWHAHTQGTVHRDLKPANVFLTASGDVKVLDFGMALLLGRAAPTGGTPAYMSPEQLRGEPEDARTDLHALGTLLREMLTGERGPTTGGQGGVPAPLSALLDELLAEEPGARPRSAQVVLDRLEAADRALAGASVWRTVAAALRPPSLGWLLPGLAIALAVTLGVWRREQPWQNPLAEARFLQLTDFDGVEQAAAISRDGRSVAFQSDRDGRMDVWVTQVGTGQFSNVTRGSAPEIVNPSLRVLGFSPDGTMVTYWGRQTLAGKGTDISVWAVPLLGGQPRRYLEGMAEFDWTGDGRRLVYHSPGPGDPMFVSGSGQTADGCGIFTAPPGLHGHFPLWSPDQAFIYFVQGSPPERMDVWRIRPAGGAPQRVTRHDANVSYPVFLDPRTLLYLATDPDGFGPWIYALDVEKLEPHRVSLGIESYTSLAASGDGRRLVATQATPRSTLWRVPFAGGRAEMSAARRVPLATGNGSSPRLGPDYLLYVSSRGAGDSLWKLQAATVGEIWSAPDARILGAPAIAPDGRRIAFSVRQGGKTVLRSVNADGSDSSVVTRKLELRGAPAWAPGGRSLTVAAVLDGLPRLFDVPLDGREPVPFVREHATDPVWSPQGDVVVYSGADVGTAFPVQAARADATAFPIPALKITRGGRHLAFAPGRRALLALRGDISHKDLWEVDLDTGAERRLTEVAPGYVLRDFDVSPDGRELVLEQEHVRSDIVLIDLPAR
jgi:Tol biopolymer transport system component